LVAVSFPPFSFSLLSPGEEPFAYLRDVLERVSTHPASRIAELLPDVWKASRSP